MKREWRSLHVYYHANQDPLLLNCLETFWSRVDASAAPPKLFFIRHWQGGPHVRLRLVAENPADPAVLDETVRDFLVRRPSTSTIDEAGFASAQTLFASIEGGSPPFSLRPNNTVEIERYAPELGKYGGDRGVAIAEDLFFESTRVAAAALRAIGDSSDRRLGLGFNMFLGAALAYGLTPSEVAAFATAYEQSWPSPPASDGHDRWEDKFEASWPTLKIAAERILSGRASPLAERWTGAVATASQRIDGAAHSICEAMDADLPDEAKRRMLLMQYIHTHNNRLGIDIWHEAYLGFMIGACLRRMGLGALDDRPLLDARAS